MALQVKTTAGVVEGREKDGVLLFAGIPYAAPPTGERRFRPPEPHEGWSGVREARRFGPAAPQNPGVGMTGTPNVRWDEDECLTLNVCTPGLEGTPRPVLVWIHGGGFLTGQGGIPWYSGAGFARGGDVVTVSINYRLGALGFAHLAELGDEFASSGLNGILDQVAALEWVRANIAAFGGDPGRVTIAGESAGGMSVGTLLGCPQAAGLFRGAIPQSGAAHHTLPDVGARFIARELMRELAADGIADLRKRSAQEVLDAQSRLIESLPKRKDVPGLDLHGLGGMPFQPVVEGRVLPRPPIEALQAGASSDVTVMVGTNLDETTLFFYGKCSDERLERVAGNLLGDAPAALAVYRDARPGASNEELLTALTTDHIFRIPALRLTEALTRNGGAAYHYLFSWKSRAFDGRLGATHALEIPFAFDTLDKPGVDVFLGEGPRPSELAATMHAAWTRFVQSGDPNGGDLPEWPRYDLKQRPVMEFGDRVGVLDDPGGAERRLFETSGR